MGRYVFRNGDEAEEEWMSTWAGVVEGALRVNVGNLSVSR